MKKTLRAMTARDLALVEQFHREQNRRDGTNYPLPPLLAGTMLPEVPVALVVEESEQVLGSLYVHVAPELCFAGCDPRATAVARRDIDALGWALLQQGFSHVRSIVPRAALAQVRRPLLAAGFRERRDLVLFSRELVREQTSLLPKEGE